jgi:ubiquinone/menaquinone biosynthesis C-methylase UbiE
MEPRAQFSVGSVEVTPTAAMTLAAVGEEPAAYVARHQAGDWGHVDAQRREDNVFGARYGHDVVSRYALSDGTEIHVETSLDHSHTRVLLASEYVAKCMVSVQEGYTLWASSYDREHNPLIGVEERYLPELEASVSAGRVLDVGAGTGRQALRWARRGAHVTAIDQSPEMLAVAREAAEAEQLAVTFQVGAIEAGLPVASSAFDLVVCSLMLTHVANLHTAIAECARAVRAGGHLLLTDLHPVCTALGWHAEVRRPGIVYALPGYRHTREDYLAALQESGCGVRRVIDAEVREVPEGYTRESFIRACGDIPFCLLILARKEAA